MEEEQDYTTCTTCGAPIDAAAAALPATPCMQCGGTSRTHNVFIYEKIRVLDGWGWKGKNPGDKRPSFEGISKPSLSHRLGKLVHREVDIDRKADTYFEKVTDYETGEVIHECREPLSQHVGHGSAKRNAASDRLGEPPTPTEDPSA
ncbi:hypothetical protein [Variovorax sp. ZT4R33]|uniref:hypothetical protein n=1 Tax=Variovorax sp. ZT4R33 TaxID=3443743 RepID=UPI003F46676F